MQKKLLSLFLAAFIILTSLYSGVSAFDDIVSNVGLNAVNTLNNLQIMTGYDDGKFYPDNNLTRAELAGLIAGAMRAYDYNSYIAVADVPATHWAYGVITYACDSKMMSVDENNNFRLEDLVTYNELVTVLARMIGYDFYAKENGGYPTGYLIAANKAGITGKFSFNGWDNATRKDAAILFYNTINAKIMEVQYSGGAIEYFLSDNTIYKQIFEKENLQKLTGIVTRTEITGLYQTEGVKTEVEIDGVSYNTYDFDFNSLLGQNVEFYLGGEDGDVPSIISVTPQKNTFFTIQDKDIVSANSSYIEYEASKGKYSKKKVESGVKVIYNGKLVQNYNLSNLNIKHGTVKLLDNNENDYYDVIFIDEFFSFVVDKAAPSIGAIYLKDHTYLGYPNIYVDLNNDDIKYSIRNKNGEPLSFSDIKAGNVITVCSDLNRTFISIIVSDKRIRGQITEFVDVDSTIVIDDNEYLLGKDENGGFMLDVSFGEQNTYLLDAYDYVIAVDEDDIPADRYAMVARKAAAKNLTASLKLELIFGGKLVETTKEEAGSPVTYELGNSDMKVYEIAAGVRLNGRKMTDSEITANLPDGSIITYELSSDGKIKSIKTIEPDYSPANSASKLAFNPRPMAFGGKFAVNKNTVIFLNSTNEISTIDDYFTVIDLDVNTTFNINSYEVDDETQIAKVARINDKLISEVDGIIRKNTPLSIITKKKTSVSEEGEILYNLIGFSDGEEFNYIVNENLVDAYNKLSIGSLAYLTTNTLGKVNNIIFVNDVTKMDAPFHEATIASPNEQIFGIVNLLKKNRLGEAINDREHVFMLKSNLNSDEILEYRIPVNGMPAIYLYDSNSAKITVAGIDDILSYEDFSNSASKLYICRNNYYYKAIVIVK